MTLEDLVLMSLEHVPEPFTLRDVENVVRVREPRAPRGDLAAELAKLADQGRVQAIGSGPTQRYSQWSAR